MTDSESGTSQKRQGRTNKHLYTREMEKNARRRGEEFVTSEGRLVEEKTTGENCNCRKKCMESFSLEQKKSIIDTVYSGCPKNEQDVYLMGLILRTGAKRHRAVSKHSTQFESSFKYFAMQGTLRREVCRKAYMSLHAVSNKVVYRLTNLVASNKSPNDMRGKHLNRGNSISKTAIAKIDEHIQSFPKKETHSGSPIKYLSAELTVRKMHDLFILKNPDLFGIVKYKYYLKYFNDNYGYRFGRPQVDVC